MEKTVKEFLTRLGLSPEEVKIYLALNQNGPLSILNISRKTDINRTKIYRIIELLQKKGIIEEIVDQHSKLIKAVSIDSLQLLIKEQELKIKYLQDTFPIVANLVSGQKAVNQPGTKVLFYRGKEGIRQQVWNTLRTVGKACGYSYRPLMEIIGDYYLKWYDEWNKRKLIFRDIYSYSYLISKKELIKNKKIRIIDNTTTRMPNIISRYISPYILDVNHQVDIYNDVVSLYNWYEGEIFGVEIYNEKVANMQRQFFEIVWNLAGRKSVK